MFLGAQWGTMPGKKPCPEKNKANPLDSDPPSRGRRLQQSTKEELILTGVESPAASLLSQLIYVPFPAKETAIQNFCVHAISEQKLMATVVTTILITALDTAFRHNGRWDPCR